MKTKEALRESARKNKDRIKDELNQLTSRTSDLGRNLLIAGSSILVGYLVYKLLSDSDEDDEPKKWKTKEVIFEEPVQSKEPSALGRIVKAVGDHLMLYILAESKAKLQDYLNTYEEESDNS